MGWGTILQGPFLGSELEYKNIIFYSPTVRRAPVPFGWKEILYKIQYIFFVINFHPCLMHLPAHVYQRIYPGGTMY